MPPTSSLLLALYAALAGAIALWVRERSKARRLPFPDGPRRLPLIGNLHQMTGNAGAFFQSLGERFGPISYINLAGQDIVVLNSLSVAKDILEKRGTRYASRPRSIFAGEYVSINKRLLFSPWSDRLKRHRSAVTRYWSPPAVRAMAQRQLDEALVTAGRLLSLTNDCLDVNAFTLLKELERFAASVVTESVYGWRCSTGNEIDLIELRQILREIEQSAVPGANLVDALPFLDLLPDFLATWRKSARAQGVRTVDLFTRLVKRVKQRMEGGDERALASFVGQLCQEQKKYDMDDLDVAFYAGTMFEAATDTTSASLSSFFFAMCMRPEVQTRAREELDRVCGQRSPTWDDIRSLPYVCTIIKEVLRWKAPIPMGIPHSSNSDEDDEYCGMRIPARATVFANTCGIHMDESEYGPFPEMFLPERWMEQANLALKLTDLSDGHIAFGVGRRYCAGHGQAVQSLFLCIANFLQKLDIQPCSGHRYDPDAFVSMLVCFPKPFPLSISARRGHKEGILHEAGNALNRLETPR